MFLAEYGGAIFALIAGFSAMAGSGTFAVMTTLSLAFAIHKGVVNGFGVCPPLHAIMIIVLTSILSGILTIFKDFRKSFIGSTTEGARSGSGMWTVILFGIFIILGPLFIYGKAKDFVLIFNPACDGRF